MDNTKDLIAKLQETTRVNVRAIAEGYYNIIPESEKECMRLGMLPKKFMDLLEDNLRDKFEQSVSTIRSFWKDVFEGMDDYLKEAMKECDEYVKSNTEKTFKDVSIEMIKIACENGLCIV